MIWDHWDDGTGHAMLALYRHADPDRLAAAGKDLGRLACPALVLWGERDPYLPTVRRGLRRGPARRRAGPRPGAGHWPWIDDARVVDRIVDFVR